MQEYFYFPIKPLSLNRAISTLRNGRRVKSREYNFYKKSVNDMLLDYQRQLSKLALLFKREIHAFEIEYIFGIKNLLHRKGKGISKTSQDVDNLPKCLGDILFAQLEQLNGEIDDSMVHKVTSRKIVADNDEIHVLISIVKWEDAIYLKTSPRPIV